MSRPILSIRTDTIARAGSKRLVDVGGVDDFGRLRGGVGRISCNYGEAMDGTGKCVLSAPYNSNVAPYLSIRSVISLRNSRGKRYEYRVVQLDDSATSGAITATAQPILTDLADVLLTVAAGVTRTSHIVGTKSIPDWWNSLILPELVRHGLDYFTLGDVDIDGAYPFDFSNESALWMLRQMVQNSSSPVRAVLRDDESIYDVILAVPTPSTKIRAVVGENIEVLDRTIDGRAIETIVIPTGATATGDTAPAAIERVPWLVSAPSGATLALSDPDVSDAPLAIEDNQFVGDPADPPVGIRYPKKALAAGWPPLTLAAPGSDTQRIGQTAQVGGFFYVAVRAGAGTDGVLHKVGTNIGQSVNTLPIGKQPAGVLYAPTQGILLVSCTGDNAIQLIDPISFSVVGAVTSITAPTKMYYHAGSDTIIVLDAAGNVNFLTLSTGAPSTVVRTGVVSDDVVSALPGPIAGLLTPTVTVHTIAGLGAIEGVVAGASFWTVNGSDLHISEIDILSQTLDATTLLVTTLTSGVPTSWAHIGYDDVNDQLWLVGFGTSTVYSLAIVNPATPAVIGELRPQTSGYHRPNAIMGYGGKVLTVGVAAYYLLFDGASGATIASGLFCAGTLDLSTIDSVNGEGWVVIGDSTGQISLWDFRTECPLILREITGVVADTSVVTLKNGHVGPLRTNFPAVMTEEDGTAMVELWSPDAVRAYGPLSYPETSSFRGEQNLLMRPVPENFESAIGILGDDLHDTNSQADIETHWHDPEPASGLYVPSYKTVGNIATGFSWTGADSYNIAVKNFPPGYVFNPGDFFELMSAGTAYWGAIRKRSVVSGAGSGTVFIQALTVGSFSVATNDPVTCYRRNPAAQQGLNNEWIVWPNIGNTGDSMSFDVLIPPAPRAGASLWFAMEAYLRASAPGFGTYLSSPVHASIVAHGLPRGGALPLLDDDMVLTAQQVTVSPDYTKDQWRDISGILQCGIGTNAMPATSFGYGWYKLWLLTNPGVIFIRRISVYWGFEGVPAFGYGNGQSGIWAVGQRALFNKGEPLVSYRVQSTEKTPELELGSVLTLIDKSRGIVGAHPRVVSWQRELEPGDVDFHRPTYELENRSYDLVAEIAQMGGP